MTLGEGQAALAEGVPAIGIRPPESMESAGSLEMPHGSTACWSEVLGGAVFVPKPVMGASATLPLPNVVGFADGFPVRYGMGSVNPPLTMISICRMRVLAAAVARAHPAQRRCCWPSACWRSRSSGDAKRADPGKARKQKEGSLGGSPFL